MHLFLALFCLSWSLSRQRLTWLRFMQQAEPAGVVHAMWVLCFWWQRPLPGPACCHLCPLGLTFSLSPRPGTWLLGSPARTSPSPAATVPSELGTKVGGLNQPAHSPHTAVVILDCAVLSGGWHAVLLGASVLGSPSSQLRASHLLCAACPLRLLSTLGHPWAPSYCLLPSPSWCEGTKQPLPTA